MAFYNELKRLSKLPAGVSPDPPTRLSNALTAAGRLHEQRVISHLQTLVEEPLTSSSSSSLIYNVPFAHSNRHELTCEAIQRRVPLIRGAALQDNVLDGYADILIRADIDPFLPPHLRAELHPLAYSICEVKFANLQTPDHVLQTASYYALLNRLLEQMGCEQGSPRAYLWMGDPKSQPTLLPCRSLSFLYSTVVNDFKTFLVDFDPERIPPEPDSAMPNLMPWIGVAERFLRDTDSLRLIAGITREQALSIYRATGVTTLKEFACVPQSQMDKLVQDGSLPKPYLRLHKQAVMQYKTRKNPKEGPTFALVSDLKRAMPPPSRNDVFFDIEGFPLAPQGGLEYLFGILSTNTGDFKTWWAHSPAQEEQAFINIVDWLNRRMRSNSGKRSYIYHYGHYEVTALRRIALKAETPQGIQAANTFESLVEKGFFFDMYKFVKSSLIIGDSSYSIKTVEKLAGISRKGDAVADAESSVGLYYEWRRSVYEGKEEEHEVNADEKSHALLHEIYSYNKRDCESLLRVVQWLRERIPKPDIGKANSDSERVCEDETDTEVDASDDGDADDGNQLMPGACGRTMDLRLIDSKAISDSVELGDTLLRKNLRSLNSSAVKALAHALQYYVRESAPDRRLFRERVETASLTPNADVLHNDDKCLVGVRYIGSTKEPASTRDIEIHAYQFSTAQNVGIEQNERVAFVMSSGSKVNESKSKSNIARFFTVKGVVDMGKGKGCIYVRGSGSGLSATANADEGGRPGLQNLPPQFGTLVSSDALTICDAPLRQSVLRRAREFANRDKKASSSLAAVFLNRDTIVENAERDESVIRMFANGASDRETVSSFLGSRKKPGVFVVQGPPGTGKTYLSGQVISDLVNRYNLTVAVTSNSHAAIDNLLSSAVYAGLNADFVWKVGTRSTNHDDGVRYKSNVRDISVRPLIQNNIVESINNKNKTTSSSSANNQSGVIGENNEGIKSRTSKKLNHATVVGATCYQLCREENEGRFDVVFVDEAGQVPMAHMIAISGCARYAVLAGDQQQLEMPIKGAHPGGIGQSCLAYMVGENVTTVDARHGIFLNTSYRMNANLCAFVSDAFYDGALLSAHSCSGNHVRMEVNSGNDDDGSNNNGQKKGIRNNTICHGHVQDDSTIEKRSGIQFIACEDDDDADALRGKWYRMSEVRMIKNTLKSLMGSEFVVDGTTRQLTEKDFMIVAPYNAQVRALRQEIGGNVRVGTVDKFQGQQAAVTLISTCTSGTAESDLDVLENDENDDINNMGGPGGGFGLGDGLGGGGRGGGGRERHQHRGLRFCLQKNRLNVAISRAQCLAVVTGDERAWEKLPLDWLDDVDMAALYKSLVEKGSKGNKQGDVSVTNYETS